MNILNIKTISILFIALLVMAYALVLSHPALIIITSLLTMGLLSFNNKQTLFTVILFHLLILVSYFTYSQGLPGIFILDDQMNLSPMGQYMQFGYWDRFWLFLLEGNSGPTGRPISLASFYLNDNKWPSHPASFTYTNILIHILNSVLVFWFTFKLAFYLKLTTLQQQVFAFIATSLWVLHPFQASTVLYIIQRMTALSALFTLTGLLFYLYGRDKLKTQPVAGLLLLFVGVGVSLLFSILSKENGILLVAFILVLEFFLLQPLGNRPPKYFYAWFAPAIILPFAAVLYYLGERAWQATGFDHRNFTFTEHLLTEPRIIFDYLYHILLPTIEGTGIFHDDYTVSRSLFEPWTTLPAILGVAGLFILMWVIRKKAPLIGFAIAWFFAGHLIESTVISLELYFEHRNYLPLLGFLIAISYYLSHFFLTHQKAVLAFMSIILTLFVFLVAQNAKTWSNPYLLVSQAFQAHPKSERAQEAYLVYMQHVGVSKEKLDKIRQLSVHEDTPYSAFSELDRACISGELSKKMMGSALQLITEKPIHGAASSTLISFVEGCLKKPSSASSTNEIEHFLIEILTLKKIKKGNAHFFHNVHLLLAEISKKKGDFNETMVHLKHAYRLFPEIEIIKKRAGFLSSMGQHQAALTILSNTSLIENQGFRVRLALKIKQKELDKIKRTISQKILENNKLSAKN